MTLDDPQKAHESEQHIAALIPADYASRPYLKGAKRKKCYRSVENFPADHVIGTYVAVPPKEPKLINAPMMKSLIIKALDRIIGKKYTFNRDQQLTLNHLCLYLVGDPSGDFDINKGIWLWGATGTGKTTVIDALYEALSKARMMRYENVKSYNRSLYSHLYDDCVNSKSWSMLSRLKGNMFIDDMMYANQNYINILGHNLMDKMVDRLYENYKYQKVKSIVTCNHDLNSLRSNEAVLSSNYGRLVEMYNVIEFPGINHRL